MNAERRTSDAYQAATPDIDANDLDFWSFIDLANYRLSEEFAGTDQQATELLLTLNRAANVITYDLEASVHRPLGLSWSTFRLMFVIWLIGPVEPKNAARLTGMSRAAVSNLTKTLESDGLVRRAAAENDGRSFRLALTDDGREKIRSVYVDHNSREHVWADGLNESERQLLVRLLDKLISNHKLVDVRGRN